MKRSVIFTLVGFAVGFISGAVVNELQQKRKSAPSIKTEHKKEEKDSEDDDVEKTPKAFESKESIISPIEVKQSYVNYSNATEEKAPVMNWEMVDRAAYADNQALGVSAEYECIELYFNINDGTCTDDDAEIVTAWEDLLGPECCDALRRQIGRGYEGIPINERNYYVKNNVHESYFHVSLIVE